MCMYVSLYMYEYLFFHIYVHICKHIHTNRVYISELNCCNPIYAPLLPLCWSPSLLSGASCSPSTLLQLLMGIVVLWLVWFIWLAGSMFGYYTCLIEWYMFGLQTNMGIYDMWSVYMDRYIGKKILSCYRQSIDDMILVTLCSFLKIHDSKNCPPNPWAWPLKIP